MFGFNRYVCSSCVALCSVCISCLLCFLTLVAHLPSAKVTSQRGRASRWAGAGAPERNPHAPVRTDRSRRHERSRAAPRCPRRPRGEKANPILNRRNRFEPLPAGLRARVAARWAEYTTARGEWGYEWGS